jgi:hypothetical protein
MAHAGGRPSKYQESMCETLVSCMQKGYIVDEVCAELGIHRDTFFEWVKIHGEFSDSYKKGKAAFNTFWAKAFKKVMLGLPLNPPRTRKSTKKGKENENENKKEEKAESLGKANPTMMIFYMKVHCGWMDTVVNKIEFSEIPDSAKDRLGKIFGESQKESEKIKPKLVSRTTRRKAANGK